MKKISISFLISIVVFFISSCNFTSNPNAQDMNEFVNLLENTFVNYNSIHFEAENSVKINNIHNAVTLNVSAINVDTIPEASIDIINNQNGSIQNSTIYSYRNLLFYSFNKVLEETFFSVLDNYSLKTTNLNTTSLKGHRNILTKTTNNNHETFSLNLKDVEMAQYSNKFQYHDFTNGDLTITLIREVGRNYFSTFRYTITAFANNVTLVNEIMFNILSYNSSSIEVDIPDDIRAFLNQI